MFEIRDLGMARGRFFRMLTPEAARGFFAQLSEWIGAAAGPISLAALPAAVVVTNTSLVSVTRRTREIGIRRAVGASRRRITLEVLSESPLLSALGDVLGAREAIGRTRSVASSRKSLAGFPPRAL